MLVYRSAPPDANFDAKELCATNRCGSVTRARSVRTFEVRRSVRPAVDKSSPIVWRGALRMQTSRRIHKLLLLTTLNRFRAGAQNCDENSTVASRSGMHARWHGAQGSIGRHQTKYSRPNARRAPKSKARQRKELDSTFTTTTSPCSRFSLSISFSSSPWRVALRAELWHKNRREARARCGCLHETDFST